MRILILNSTHTKYPVGKEKWIQETIRAIRDLSADGRMICSLNPLQWDLATHCCSDAGCDVDMLIPHCEENGVVDHTDILKGDFVFGPGLLDIHYYNNGNKSGTKSAWQNRDDMALTSADIIVPVSLRPKGRLLTRLHENIRGKRIVTDYHVPWTKSQSRPRYDFQGYTINNLPPGDWLIHWTRASQGYWPGESKAEFWRDVLADPDRYVRSAGDTLLNITRRTHSRVIVENAGQPQSCFSLSPENIGGTRSHEMAKTVCALHLRALRYRHEERSGRRTGRTGGPV